MANKRLLTDKEIDTFNNYGDSWISEDDWAIKELLQAQDKKTLQEVGEWLDKAWHLEADKAPDLEKGIEALKRGEWPDDN